MTLSRDDQTPAVFDPALHQVRFTALGGGRSELVMTEHGYISDELMTLSEAGLSQCFDKMAAALSA